MKVCVSSIGNDLNSEVDSRFGRCQYFVVVDVDSMEYKAFMNESAMGMGGVGVQAAQTVIKTGAEVLITGNVGPNAFQVLSESGIKILTGVSGTVNDVIDKFKEGALQEAPNPSVEAHAGIGGEQY